jgi:type II secretory pathway component PulJ
MTTADRIAELERRAEALRAELRRAEAAVMLCRARVEGIEVEIEWLRQEEADA